MKKRIDIESYPVRKQKCPSCPFRINKKGRHPDQYLVAKIQQKCLTIGSQICHDQRLNNKESNSLCRGARDFQLKVFTTIQFLEEATDQAWENKTNNPL